MRTPGQRGAIDRHGLRYPSDLSNAERALVEPMIPPAKHGGRKRSNDVREVLNAILYALCIPPLRAALSDASEYRTS